MTQRSPTRIYFTIPITDADLMFHLLRRMLSLSKVASSSVWTFPVGIFHTFFENEFSSEVNYVLVMETLRV